MKKEKMKRAAKPEKYVKTMKPIFVLVLPVYSVTLIPRLIKRSLAWLDKQLRAFVKSMRDGWQYWRERFKEV